MRTIVTTVEAKTLGRPIGKVADEKITAFIIEVEQTIIKKALGDVLYMDILDNEDSAKYETLLDGGMYFDKCNNSRYITGLKTAIAYYVYAQNVRAGDFESTRYGMVIKDGQYSTPISSKDRDTAANSATEVANAYLKECIEYCKEQGFIKTEGRGNSHITTGCIIKKIKV